jgi:predicted homoserine dehydrogenase-like protein
MAVRIAVIGAGYFAHFHQDAWMRLPGAELVGICDLEGERAAAAAAVHGVPAFTDREEMFAATKPDLVDIATPQLEVIFETLNLSRYVHDVTGPGWYSNFVDSRVDF